MPSPREIAKQVNSASLFEEPKDPIDEIAPQGKERDYAANPVNPPEPPAPAKNLR